MRALRLLVLLLLATTTRAAVLLPADSDEWTTLAAGELRIYSNASPRVMREVATNLLRMREAMARVTTLDVRAARPMYVLIFRNHRAFAAYRDTLFGKPEAPVSGTFVEGRTANYIMLDASTSVARVGYHELTHAFMRNTMPKLPLWLDEGLAEYYSTFSVHGDEVRIGERIPEHMVALRRRQPLIPLEQFFAMERADGPRFYAQAWALVHALLSGGDGRLDAFLDALRAGKSIAEATPLLGTDYAAMAQEIRAYVRRPVLSSHSYRIDELTVPEPAPARRVARDELLYVFGSLFAGTRGTEGDGERLLAEAVRLNPSHSEAHVALGFARQARGDRAGATDHFGKAIALGSRDATVRLLHAQALYERDAEAARSAQRLYDEGKREAAIEAMRAVAATTEDEALKEELQGALAVHEELTASAAEEQAMRDIITAAIGGRTKDALALIDALLAKTTDEELRARLAAMRADLAKR